MKLEEFFRNYRIPYSADRIASGWLHIKCPFCDDHGTHLGGNIENGAFNCWRCGPHDVVNVISKLLGISKGDAIRTANNYRDRRRPVANLEANKAVINALKYVRLPSQCSRGIGRLQELYLEKRGFHDLEYLEDEWGLMSTGPLSYIEDLDYRYRLLAPIYWDQKLVSFQARDATGKAKIRYMTCPKDCELIHHKHILYLHPDISDVGICVEGIFDVWRLGVNAFATFGIEWTRQQLRQIASNFNQVLVLFDRGDQAQHQAEKLVSELKFRGVDCENISDAITTSDPADMTQKEADRFIKSLGFAL